MNRSRTDRRFYSRIADQKGKRETGDPLWYKDAVIYQVHVKSFYDANGDGVGDFEGLIEKLDYIASLGVNTVWLLPFYPSPRRDDGYDISEYRGVHSDYGTKAEARRFIHEAHRRGLRVITELVVNHTSDQHPWFQRARKAKPGSAARNFYVWSDSDQGYSETRIIFCDTEKSNWTWDPVAKAYYWHRFYSHQPDLNFDNPQVLKAILSVMHYWLDLGVDGLRLDAVPYLIEREGTSNENLPETHAILKQMRKELDRNFTDRMLLAEANMWPEDVRQYFGDSDECHMAFHFPLMPRMYMAIAQEDRFPITDILRQTPPIPSECQWAIFLRNHDELTLEMVTDRERDYLWKTYAADARARINLGIRRRLMPLLERDRRRVELLNSFLLSMPGTPVLYYGDEIGMGDNVHLGDRDGVRTPMQWTPDRNGGFSRANPATLVLPPIMDATYGYAAVNVEVQSTDPYSLLNWTRRMLEVRKQHKAFGRGTLSVLYPSNRRILAYVREYHDQGGNVETILCVANVSKSAQAVELDLSFYADRVPVEMVGGSAFPPVGKNPYVLTLPPYAFYWFMLATETTMPSWHVAPPAPLPDYITLILRQHVSELLEPDRRTVLERDVLPVYVPMRRWYARHEGRAPTVRIAAITALPGSAVRPHVLPSMLVEIDVSSQGDGGDKTERYLLPFGFIREEDIQTALPQQLALARVRRGRKIGYLTDAFALDTFSFVVLDLVRKQARLPNSDGEMHFIAEAALERYATSPEPDIRRFAVEQSNTSLVIADTIVIKVYRRLKAGRHPEAEMGRYLTRHGYKNSPEFLGEVVRVAADGTPTSLLLLQQYIYNQGDAWQWTLDTLGRAVEQGVLSERSSSVQETSALSDPTEELTKFAGILGTRLGEMHATLAQSSGEADFDPQLIDDDVVAHWSQGICNQLDSAFEVLRHFGEWPDERNAMRARQLLQRRSELLECIEANTALALGSLQIRIHGDFHLGQVLVAQGDVYIVDFEGEPTKSLEDRCARHHPLKDVAGLLRSFDYVSAMAFNAGPGDLNPAAEDRKNQMLERFRPTAYAAFLNAYRTARSALLHVPPETEQILIRLFMLEKAAYEICYEAQHRPLWLPVPVAGMAHLTKRLLKLE